MSSLQSLSTFSTISTSGSSSSPLSATTPAISPLHSPSIERPSTVNGPNYIPYVPRGILKRYLYQPTRLTEPRLRPLSHAVVAFFDISGFTSMTEHFSKQGPRGSEIVPYIILDSLYLKHGSKVRDILSHFFSQLLVIIENYGGDVIKFAGDAVLVLFEPSFGLSSSLVLPPNIAQQRALACALECVRLEHKENGIILRLKAAVACGAVMVADVGKLERWELFLGGPALHCLGNALHDAPVGRVVVAKHTWTAVSAFATGDIIESTGNVLLTSLSIVVPPDTTLANQWQAMYDQAIARTDVNNAVAVYVPASARIRLSELSASLIDDYRELTVMFCSLLSTELLSQSISMLQDVCCRTLEVLDRYRGSLRQFLHEDKGITIIGLFGLPGNNYMDDPTRAVRAAYRLRRSLEKIGVKVAIGLCTGRMFCGTVGSKTRHEYAAVGPKVNLAARLMQAAEGREPPILCDAETVDAAKETFKFTPCTPIHVKGKEEAVDVYLPGEKNRAPSTRRPHTAQPLLGREKELVALKSVIEKTMNSKVGQVVLLMGFPGSGKTTLLQFVAQEMSLHAASITCRESGRGGAFGAVNRLIVSLLETRHLLRDKREKKQILQEITRSIVAMHRSSLLAYLSLLNSVLSVNFPATAAATLIDGRQRRDRLYELLGLLCDYLVRMPARIDDKPLTTLITINNYEACDESSALFFAHWAATPSFKYTVLVLSTMMTTSEEIARLPSSVSRLPSSSKTVQITMSDLTTEQLLEVVAEDWHVPVADLPPELAPLLADRALGNPMAAIVLASVLKEKSPEPGEARSPQHYAGVNSPTPGEVVIPAKIFRLVTPEFDRWPLRVAHLVFTAALLGREFSFLQLMGALPPDTDERQVREDLVFLESKCTLRPEGVAEDESQQYVFVHTLIADVAAQCPSFSQRKEIHARIAEYLRPRLKEHQPDACAVLGHHLVSCEQWIEGVNYLRIAAEQYAATFTVPEAVSLYKKLIRVTTDHPEAASIEVIVSFYRSAGILLESMATDNLQLQESKTLLLEGLACAGKPMLSGEEIKSKLVQLKCQLLRRLNRKEYLGKAANKKLCHEICRIAEKLLISSLIFDVNPDGYEHFGLFVTLLEAAEDADDAEYLLWTYTNSPPLLQCCNVDLHPLFTRRLPQVWHYFAEEDTERHGHKCFELAQLMELQRSLYYTKHFATISSRIRLVVQSYPVESITNNARLHHTLNFTRIMFLAMHEGRGCVSIGQSILSTPQGQYFTLLRNLGLGMLLEGHLMLGHTEAAEAVLKEFEELGFDRITPLHRFSHLTYLCRILQSQRLFNEDFCNALEGAWLLVPSIPVRAPQMFCLGLLIQATIAAVEAGPLLAIELSITTAETRVEELLYRMWPLGPMFQPWCLFLWSYQGLYFQVFAKQPAKARTCFLKAEAIARELHSDAILGRLLLQRARYAPMAERKELYEEASRRLNDGSDPLSAATARDGLSRLTRSLSHA